jgi:hypothetical protein
MPFSEAAWMPLWGAVPGLVALVFWILVAAFTLRGIVRFLAGRRR